MLLDPPHQLLEKLNLSTSQYYKNVIPHIMGFQNSCSINIIQVYKSLILSKLDYESFIWTTSHKSISKILDKIHNSGLRMSIGAYLSSPIPSIYNLTCTHYLDIRRFKITLNHELKLASILPTLDFKPIFQMLPTLLQENNLDTSKVLIITPTLAPNRKISPKLTLNFLDSKKTKPPFPSTKKNIFT